MAKQFITSLNDDDWYIWDTATQEVKYHLDAKHRLDQVHGFTLPGQSYGRGMSAKHLRLWREAPAVTCKAVAYSNGATELQQVITPIAAQPGQFSVSYGSQYFGAKNPEGLHRKLQFVTDEAGLKRLAENLLSFCNTR